jgi:hypothetical protein
MTRKMPLTARKLLNAAAACTLAAIGAAYILMCVSCAPLPPASDGSVTDPNIHRAHQVIDTVEQLKTVADFVFGIGCTVGKFDEGTCETYQLSAQAADMAIKLANERLAAYEKDRTIFSAAALQDALAELEPLITTFMSLDKAGK